MKFSELSLKPDLLNVIAELGYTDLTPIQEQSIPLLLSSADVIGQSQTGSGKTAAFALPILQNLNLSKRFPQALILCPTRELCTQVAREVRRLGRRYVGLHVIALAGGERIGPQLASMEHGAHIIVGTPGRIMDHLERRSVSLRSVKTVVLDEADRMLDMGFEESIEFILGRSPRERQTVLFSATFPESIEELSEKYQNEPKRITIEGSELQTKTILHKAVEVPTREDKPEALVKILASQSADSAIVFCNMKATAAELADMLLKEDISADAIHGDLEQFDRNRVMAKFRNRSTRVLLATDVAARGIDVDTLDLVVNYDLPLKSEVYVHRSGRTGRAGRDGVAISIFATKEKHKISRIEDETQIEFEILGNFEKSKTVTAPATAAMMTLSISGGRKEKVRPGDILGALTGEAGGLASADVGKIEIHDHFSYVAIAANVAMQALRSLQNGKIKGRKFLISLVE